MATKKKLLQAAAGTAAASGGAGGLNVEDVFSTYLYEGNGSSQVIDNGINLGQSYGSGGISLVRSSQSEVHTSSSNDFAYGSGDFTWEAWIMPQVDDGTLNSSNMYIFDHGTGGSGNGGTLTYNYANGGLQYYDPTNSVVTSTQTITNYTWAHVAVVRVSGILKVYYNGSQIISFTSSHSFTDASFIIGGYGGGGLYNWQGVISEVRVSNTARYTNTFTPPTATFTSDSNTILLTGQGSTLVDNSSNSLTLTAYGDAEATSFGPFDAADAGEGGMVFFKNRNTTDDWHTYDTERGTSKRIALNQTTAQYTGSSTYGLTSFNSNGFSVGTTGAVNNNGSDLASWTFRKAPKFFDVVTWSGNSTAGRAISHNLGTTVGAIFVKEISDSAEKWRVYHRSHFNSSSFSVGSLNESSYFDGSSDIFNSQHPSSTEFYLGGSGYGVNESGENYVAYLFAHNDGDGDFGPTGDQDIIKCGSCTTNSDGSLDLVDLGFEPQWLMFKTSASSGDWQIHDTMRDGTLSTRLAPNTTAADASYPSQYLKAEPTGFSAIAGWGGVLKERIYIAIRRGPMAVPTDATDVFAIDDAQATSGSGPAFISNFVTDMLIEKQPSTTGSWPIGARLQGNQFLRTDTTGAETTGTAVAWDYMNGAFDPFSASPAYQGWMWKRAPSYFDVVAYTGNGTAGRTVSHNLGVAPEMIWIKDRDGTNDWIVYHSGVSNSYGRITTAAFTSSNVGYYFGNNDQTLVSPTDSVFTIGGTGAVNWSGRDFIAYLFASLDGVSKVGSFTAGSTDTFVDCGFSSSARFVLMKRSSGIGDWFVYDSERGYVAGTGDKRLKLNTTDAETTNNNIDPTAGGFTVTGNTIDAGTYIFYAIA